MTLSQLWRAVFYTLWPPLAGRSAARQLKQRLGSTDLVALDDRYAGWIELPVDTLDKLIVSERDRAKALEEKAAKLSAVLAIALTIGSTFGKSFIDDIATPGSKTGIRIGFFTSVVFLLAGGWHGFMKGVMAYPQVGYGPDWELELLKSENKKRTRAEALVHFELSNLLRSNDVSVALECVRNSVMVFALTILYAFIEPLAEPTYKLIFAADFCMAAEHWGAAIKHFFLRSWYWFRTH